VTMVTPHPHRGNEARKIFKPWHGSKVKSFPTGVVRLVSHQTRPLCLSLSLSGLNQQMLCLIRTIRTFHRGVDRKLPIYLLSIRRTPSPPSSPPSSTNTTTLFLCPRCLDASMP